LSVALDQLALGSHQKVVAVHCRDFLLQLLSGELANVTVGGRDASIGLSDDFLSGLLALLVDGGDQLQATAEETLAQGCADRALHDWYFLTEELEVAAEVENIELVFVLARAEEVGALARAPSDHLPELGLGADQLEEDQVDLFRDIHPVAKIGRNC
jgi:hypothetical protein